MSLSSLDMCIPVQDLQISCMERRGIAGVLSAPVVGSVAASIEKCNYKGDTGPSVRSSSTGRCRLSWIVCHSIQDYWYHDGTGTKSRACVTVRLSAVAPTAQK